MKTFFITFLFTTSTFLGFVLLINFCRNNLRQTEHGLTGMCHKNGGKICAACSETMAEQKKHHHRTSTNKKH